MSYGKAIAVSGREFHYLGILKDGRGRSFPTELMQLLFVLNIIFGLLFRHNTIPHGLLVIAMFP
jgi:hypothetical protein